MSDSKSDERPRGSLLKSIAMLRALHGSSNGPIALLTLTGMIAGALEATALVLFIRGALAITSGESEVEIAGYSLGSEPSALLAIAAGCMVVAIGAHTVLARGAARLSLAVLANARTRLIDGFMNAKWAHQATQREGTLQETASTLAQRASSAATFLVLGASSVAILIALLLASVIVSPTVSLAMMGVLIPVLLVLQPITRMTRRRSHESVSRTNDFAVAVASTTTLAREYRTFGVQRHRAAELHELTRDASKRAVKTRTSNMMASFLFKDLALIAIIGIIAVLHLLTDLRAASTTAAVFLIIRSLGYAQLAYNVFQNSAEEHAAISRLTNHIHLLESAKQPDGHRDIATIGQIVFSDVTFDYEASRPALTNVNLRIERGTAVGLIGPSGSGKTTIAELLLGLRAPSGGRIEVDGHDLASIRRASWTALVAFVPQDPRLAEATIADNIRFWRPGIDNAAVAEAARKAHILDAIEALPDGFDTMLGARSTGLSGGQRQRLAIARALAGSPSMLVLDEPTSALDARSEELFRQTLAELKGSVTLVVIAHRPTTLDVCDTVVVVENGQTVHAEASDTSAAGS